MGSWPDGSEQIQIQMFFFICLDSQASTKLSHCMQIMFHLVSELHQFANNSYLLMLPLLFFFSGLSFRTSSTVDKGSNLPHLTLPCYPLSLNKMDCCDIGTL